MAVVGQHVPAGLEVRDSHDSSVDPGEPGAYHRASCDPLGAPPLGGTCLFNSRLRRRATAFQAGAEAMYATGSRTPRARRNAQIGTRTPGTTAVIRLDTWNGSKASMKTNDATTLRATAT